MTTEYKSKSELIQRLERITSMSEEEKEKLIRRIYDDNKELMEALEKR
jgi:hypothetical protein